MVITALFFNINLQIFQKYTALLLKLSTVSEFMILYFFILSKLNQPFSPFATTTICQNRFLSLISSPLSSISISSRSLSILSSHLYMGRPFGLFELGFYSVTSSIIFSDLHHINLWSRGLSGLWVYKFFLISFVQKLPI